MISYTKSYNFGYPSTDDRLKGNNNSQAQKLALDPTVVAEWSKALSKIQVERMPQVPGSNPSWGMYLYGTFNGPNIYIDRVWLKTPLKNIK